MTSISRPLPPPADAPLEEVAAYYDQHDTVGPDGEFEGEPVEIEIGPELESVYLVPLEEHPRRRLRTLAAASGQNEVELVRGWIEKGLTHPAGARRSWITHAVAVATGAAGAAGASRWRNARRPPRPTAEPPTGLSLRLRDLGLGVWFGVTVTDMLALRSESASVPDPVERAQASLQRALVNLLAMTAHMVGEFGVRAERVRTGPPGPTPADLVLIGAAIAATAYRVLLTRRLVGAVSATHRGSLVEEADAALWDVKAQQRLDVLWWVPPVATGSIVARRLGQVAGGSAGARR